MIPQPFGSFGGQVGIGGIPALFETAGVVFVALAWAVSACSEADPITARARTRARTTFFMYDPLERILGKSVVCADKSEYSRRLV